jgi:hypothetical protein
VKITCLTDDLSKSGYGGYVAVHLSFPSTQSVCVIIFCFYLLALGSFLDAVTEDQRVDARVEVLLRLAKQSGSYFWASEDRTRHIVLFQDRATQVREFLDFCTSTLAMVYNAMFSRNPQPATLPDLMKKFQSVHHIHDFVKA